jgi:L-lactate dehydrogenase (cytochrome)
VSRDHGPADLAEYVRLEDFEPAARRVLEPSAYAYITCGAGDELTVARNREAFARRTLQRPGARRRVAH